MRGYLWDIVEEPKKGWKAHASEYGPNVDYDPTRTQYFVNELEGPALDSLYFEQPFHTDLSLPDLQKDDKELDTLYSPERENLQLWTSQQDLPEDSIFISLMLPQEAYKRYKHIKGLDEDLHMTLVYVPKAKTSDDQQQKILKALSAVAKDHKPMKCELTGMGTFDNGNDTVVALVNVLEGACLYENLITTLEKAYKPWKRSYGYLPHVTLKMDGNGKASLDQLKDFSWTARHLTVKFTDTAMYAIKFGSGEIKKTETLNKYAWVTTSLKLASPETYTDSSDIFEDKTQFDDRSLMFQQNDHLSLENQRDWLPGETDYEFFNSPPIHRKIDEDLGQANIARSGLEVPVITSTEQAQYFGQYLTPETAQAYQARRDDHLQTVKNKTLPVQERLNASFQAQFLREALEEYARTRRAALDLPNAEDYSDYYLALDIQPDEVVKHTPTVRHENEDIVKYRLDPGNEEMFFEKGLHQDLLRKEVTRPVTPFGSLTFSEVIDENTGQEKAQPGPAQTPPENLNAPAPEEPEEAELIEYPTPEDIIESHNEVVAEYGGRPGLLPITLEKLQAAIGRMQSGTVEKEFYPEMVEKAAVLAHSIITSHPFPDGNKRTAFLATVEFLHDNGFTVPNSELLADAVLAVAEGKAEYRHLLEAVRNQAKNLRGHHDKTLRRLS